MKHLDTDLDVHYHGNGQNFESFRSALANPKQAHIGSSMGPYLYKIQECADTTKNRVFPLVLCKCTLQLQSTIFY